MIGKKNDSQHMDYAYLFCLTLIAAFFFLIFRCVPVINDAWASYFFYHDWGGILPTIRNGIIRYFLINGRVLATIICAFFEQNDILVDFAMVAIMVFIVFLCSFKFPRKQNLWAALAITGLLLAVSTAIRVEVYFYAMLIYMIGVLLCLQAVFAYERLINQSTCDSKLFRRALVWVCLSCLWLEHMAFGVVAALSVIDLYRLINHRSLSKQEISIWFFASVSAILMMLSTVLTGTRSLTTDTMSIFHLIRINAESILSSVLFEEPLLIVCLLAIGFTYVKMNGKSGTLKTIYLVIDAVYIIVFALLWLNSLISIHYLDQFVTIIKTMMHSRIMISVQFCAWGFVFVVLLVPLYSVKKRKSLVMCYLIGIFSLIPSLITPNNLGARINSLAVFMMVCSYAMLFASQKRDQKTLSLKIVTAVLCFALVIGLDTYSVITLGIHSIQQERERRIKLVRDEQTLHHWDYDEVLALPAFSYDQLYCGASFGMSDVHYSLFLKYYGLAPDTLVAFNTTDDVLKVKKGGSGNYYLTYEPAGKHDNFIFRYIMRDYSSYYATSELTNAFNYVFTPPEGTIEFFFEVQVLFPDGKQYNVVNPKMFRTE